MKIYPDHIAFIMDGNNRWSAKNKKTKHYAYNKGAFKLVSLSNYIFKKYNTNYISAFALSRNNMSRSKNFMKIFIDVFNDILNEFSNNKNSSFKINFLGDLSIFNSDTKFLINKVQKQNANSKKTLNIFINYSGQDEIVKIANLKINKVITQQNIQQLLYTKGLPFPDMLIRSGGFKRISDFMLYQISYTELFFTEVLWPDISNQLIDKLIHKFYSIDRKYGL